ncbi:Bax inhibitor-1/YccA family protein [Paradevosia shaoguanensis]|jgi:FtsH-binding integral membrane protein|uniref:Bax inhibitor-1/YccA family protein n=1 Tax=Paradevosia shaoguanensis TaxID=1335043 RepID=A0AA41QQX5_9HYPH|nr:Bax inhibitor-1/YccA family protein [Paradevosia shaoguanensis]KFL25796.1 membrane protein [Devosia sp. 17-2-E-8]MCF1744671.1 Bax inhibitor-1/YccA family protein [Paradevosia shaoguanensis]MCI0129154.1 Bax inhibitor-1/YccA family protein [Paradevosia shaoguanensis]QMV00428.1 BAX inhibitor (BI)-1/YccA family protein [Devosia sp. D6-9]
MAQFDRPTISARAGSAAAIDEGLRSYMLRVYNYMGLGLVVTGLVAWFANSAAVTTNAASAAAQLGDGTYLTSWGVLLYTSPLMWVVALAPLAFVLVLSFGINKLSTGAAQLTFWAFAAVMGLSLSSIFMVYTDTSIAKVFFITAAMFGAMSLWGYTTKRDLTGMGSFLFMGLIGIIIASIVNIFFNSGALSFGISIVGVLVFVGLTAYDTQKIKESYSEAYGADVLAKNAIMGALSLYLDFINLFLMLLRLFGNRD